MREVEEEVTVEKGRKEGKVRKITSPRR